VEKSAALLYINLAFIPHDKKLLFSSPNQKYSVSSQTKNPRTTSAFKLINEQSTEVEQYYNSNQGENNTEHL